jgi:hypothetical protein
MSLGWNWDSPTPLAASECALPPVPKGGGANSPAAKGVGESQFQRLEKRLALCLLCGATAHWSDPNLVLSKTYFDSLGRDQSSFRLSALKYKHSQSCTAV